MPTISAGSSQTFTALVRDQLFTLTANGGALGTVTGAVSASFGPGAERRAFGPFAVGQAITVTVQAGEVTIEYGDASPGDGDPPFTRLVGVRGATASLTGTTAETLLCPAIKIPAGWMGADSIMKMDVVFTFTANTNGKTYNIKIGQTEASAASVFTRTRSGGTAQLDALCILIANKGATNSQEVLTAPTGLYSINSTSAPTTNSIDFSVDQYVYITGTLANAADTVAMRGYCIRIDG